MLERFSRRIGYEFRQPQLLREAVTHRSHSTPNNERLEFLGDSILNCATAIALYERFPKLPEGDLSRLRANLVNKNVLFELAEPLGMGDVLRLGEGELKSGGHRRPSILADALEAVIGAVYQDSGFAAAAALVHRLLANKLENLDPKQLGKDAKTLLQEYLQGKRLPLPKYSVVAVRGEAHEQIFHIACDIDDLSIHSEAEGNSRRAAEQAAAELALKKIHNN
ncbi:MAG: ribonuclease III [Pseudomonadota bacterium]